MAAPCTHPGEDPGEDGGCGGVQLGVGRLEAGDDGRHERVELRLAHGAAVLEGAQDDGGEAVREAVVVQLQGEINV